MQKNVSFPLLCVLQRSVDEGFLSEPEVFYSRLLSNLHYNDDETTLEYSLMLIFFFKWIMWHENNILYGYIAEQKKANYPSLCLGRLSLHKRPGYVPVAHNSLCFPPNFAGKYSWEYTDLPRVFHNNSLCKIWGTNRVNSLCLKTENGLATDSDWVEWFLDLGGWQQFPSFCSGYRLHWFVKT